MKIEASPIGRTNIYTLTTCRIFSAKFHLDGRKRKGRGVKKLRILQNLELNRLVEAYRLPRP